MRSKRVFLIVLDSLGIGALPDADSYGDAGSNTLASISRSLYFSVPNLRSIGLFNIDGVTCGEPSVSPRGSFGRMAEQSAGKDTTIGHWELAGVISRGPLPTYPDGFPAELIAEFEKRCGHPVLCNRPYSGTEVIRDYGAEQIRTGALIVYTSADSVFQVAAHEQYIGLGELYRCCEIARGLLTGEHGVGRVIARPFAGEFPDFHRTANRRDYSLPPPEPTMLDLLSAHGFETVAVGKIEDIFAGRGIGRSVKTKSNREGMDRLLELQREDFHGLCFANLVDFDMLYGHRNDVDGYARALSEFDVWLGAFLAGMRVGDTLFITADHGCDPGTESTDHSREYVPLLRVTGANSAENSIGNFTEGLAENLCTLDSFARLADMVCAELM